MIIDGKKIAAELLEELKKTLGEKKYPRAPKLAYFLIGKNPASHIYVKHKVKACERIGIETQGILLESETTQKEVLDHLLSLNEDPSVDAILVQMPLPAHLDEQKIIESIDPKKDVDGFHPLNIGRLLLGHKPYFVPCTPLGIQYLLEKMQIPVKGKHVVILGRSNIVGKPLAALLVQKDSKANATVTLAHSHTQRLKELCLSADILVAAMGTPEFIDSQMVKEGAVVIDVGINRLNDRLIGDVHFDDVFHKAAYITPVPKGVGPMTIAMLLKNTVESFLKKHT